MTKAHSPVRVGLILCGLLCFCNPHLAVVDILPDFIGCLFIYVGLYRAARLHPILSDAQRSFLRFALFDAVKTVGILMIFGSGNKLEQPSLLLIAAFLSAVLGLCFAIPAIKNLCEGLSLLGRTYDCAYLYAATKKERSRPEQLQRALILFFCVRETLALLPELSALTLSSYSDSYLNFLYDYIGLLRFFAFIPAFILAIVTVCRLIAFARGFARETEFGAKTKTAYADFIKTHPGVKITSRHTVSFVCLAVGAFFLADFYIDFKNVIPDVVGGVLLLFGVLLLSAPIKKKIPALVGASLFSAVAVYSTRLSYRFSLDYSANEISRSEEAADAYLKMWLFSLLEMLLFLLLLAFLLLLLRFTVRSFAGYRAGDTEGDFESRSQGRLIEEFDRRFLRVFVAGFVSALLSFVYDYMQEIPVYMPAGFPRLNLLRFLEIFWFYDFIGALVFAFMLSATLLELFNEIKQRYLYD